MSLFGKILEKLGMKKQEAPAVSATTAKQAVKPASSAQAATPPKPAPYRPTTTSAPAPQTPRPTAQPAAPTPAPMEMVDVLSKLETMAKGTNLDWKVSIVDLLKVLGLESSLEARKELATELNCPADVMADNVKMNVWLHKTVLAEIAKNGGNIPKELLD
jgi:hypothetical protein